MDPAKALGQAWQDVIDALPSGWDFSGVARARYWPEGRTNLTSELIPAHDPAVYQYPYRFVARVDGEAPDGTALTVAASGYSEHDALVALTAELARLKVERTIPIPTDVSLVR